MSIFISEIELTNRLFCPLVPTLVREFQSFFDYRTKMLQTTHEISGDGRKETGNQTDGWYEISPWTGS